MSLLSSLPAALAALQRHSGAHYQHALLGQISFALISYSAEVQGKFAANYAEHALIDGKPRLQWTGDKLNDVNWKLVFHADFCDPTRELNKLRAAIAAHEALPLVYANGDYKGWFVPTEADLTLHRTTADGAALWIEVKLALREYVAPRVLAEQRARQPAQAAEKPASHGTRKKPARTVRKTPPARPKNASICRCPP
ncbi:phage tail protein [Herbaspirillum seropedicae]|uniref:Uncharacterized protein n=1 Tax=Herbaspirillum seropedicae (strain SmR1) TaxID=757424 RepID=D8IV23_HERSS|nr:phage tail protein [Herbaspirillum seropedicae]ADJ61742.1 conserved hypothetical protein [Herbaspirillum seropedicae SmR1]UMU19854.1 phage tail protein [Herbaspirillum seropedicae]